MYFVTLRGQCHEISMEFYHRRCCFRPNQRTAKCFLYIHFLILRQKATIFKIVTVPCETSLLIGQIFLQHARRLTSYFTFLTENWFNHSAMLLKARTQHTVFCCTYMLMLSVAHRNGIRSIIKLGLHRENKFSLAF